MKQRPFFQTALLSVLGRAGGLIIPFLIARVYGADAQTDAFFFAYSFSIAVTSLFSHMFEAAIIPYLAALHDNNLRVSWLLRQAFLRCLPVFVAAGLILAACMTPLLSRGTGWSEEEARQIAWIFTGMQPFLWLGLAAAAANGFFYYQARFSYPAISPLIRASLVILCLFTLHRSLGIYALVAGLGLGELVRVYGAFLLNRRPALQTGSYEGTGQDRLILQKFFRDAFWQTAALFAIHLMVVTDQWFAARAGSGSLSLLSYADRLIQIPYLFFLSGFLHIFHADWARAALRPAEEFKTRLRRDLIFVAAGSAAAAVLLASQASFFTGIFYGTDKLSAGDKQTLTSLFFWYAIALAPGVVRLALGRVLIVLKASRFYFAQAWLELAVNVVLNEIFMRQFGVAGIAISTAVVYSLSTGWLALYLKGKKLKALV